MIIGDTNNDLFEGDITIRSTDGTDGSSTYSDSGAFIGTEDVIEVRTGTGNLSLEMAGEGDVANVYAELMSAQSDLSIEGAGKARVLDFGGDDISINQGVSAYNYVDLYLDDDDGNQTVTINNLASATPFVTIHTGSYDETDTIQLTGSGTTQLHVEDFNIQVVAAADADLRLRLGDNETTTDSSQASVFVDASQMIENSDNTMKFTTIGLNMTPVM